MSTLLSFRYNNVGADDFWQETLRKRSSKRSIYSASKRFVIVVAMLLRKMCVYGAVMVLIIMVMVITIFQLLLLLLLLRLLLPYPFLETGLWREIKKTQ